VVTHVDTMQSDVRHTRPGALLCQGIQPTSHKTRLTTTHRKRGVQAPGGGSSLHPGARGLCCRRVSPVAHDLKQLFWL
jgi:hypothetical protein